MQREVRIMYFLRLFFTWLSTGASHIPSLPELRAGQQDRHPQCSSKMPYN